MFKFRPDPGVIINLLRGCIAVAALAAAAAVPLHAERAAVGLHCGSDFSISQYEAFGSWLGRKVKYRVVFLDRSSWSSLKQAEVVRVSKRWVESSPGRVEVISVPMFANGSSGKFSEITSGQRDAVWRGIARRIKDAGIAKHVIIRLGWEGNGDWYKWSYLHRPEGYRNAFRHIVNVMRSVAPALRFEFNVSNLASRGANGVKWTAGYPGNKYVDVISMDIYDHWNSWETMMYGDAGLKELRDFAKAHNKPEAYTEWSLKTGKHGHGDNPKFVRNLATWIEARPGGVLYQAYWNTEDSGGGTVIYSLRSLLSPLVPKAAKVYKEVFGPLPKASASNTAPWISAISDRIINVNGSTGTITFTVGDNETPARDLKIKKNVSDPSLIPLNRVVLGGSGKYRTVTIRPVSNKTGWSTVWLKVSDGQRTTTRAFVVQVSAHLKFRDIGNPSIAGTHKHANGGLRMTAGGRDIYGRHDEFHFGHVPLTGDAELTVRVASLTNTSGWAKAGLMFRGGLADNPKFVAVFVTPNHGIVLQWRREKGGYCSSSPSVPGRAPKWLRLTRSGNSFYAFYSNDGSDWDLVEIVENVALPQTAQCGIALTSHAPNERATAEFRKFAID